MIGKFDIATLGHTIRKADATLQLDNIESNIVSVNNDVTSAGEELRTAHDYQRKAGRRMLCLMLILAFVAAIVLLAVSHKAMVRKKVSNGRRRADNRPVNTYRSCLNVICVWPSVPGSYISFLFVISSCIRLSKL